MNLNLPLMTSEVKVYHEAIEYFTNVGEDEVAELLTSKFLGLLTDEDEAEDDYDDDEDLDINLEYIDLENAANVAYRLGFDVPEDAEDSLEKEIAKVCGDEARYYDGLEDIDDELYLMGNKTVEKEVKDYCESHKFPLLKC
jgi:hypothetical protein